MPSAIGSIAALAAIALLAGPHVARAQEPRADLTGPFIHLGGVAGSVTRDSGPVDENHSGYGWGAGGGINLSRWFSVVADYTIFRVSDEAAQKYNLSQSAVGVRLRVGGDRTPVVFYVEGGAAIRSAMLSSAEVFAGTPPANASTAVQLDGWSGWFGPGAQFFVFGPRVPLEVSVVWAWGTLNHTHIDGATSTLADPIGITTLRMRVGFAAMLF